MTNSVEVDGGGALLVGAQDGGEVVERGLGHAGVIHNSTAIRKQLEDMIFLLPISRMDLQNGSAGLTLLEPAKTCTVTSNQPLK